ncbi:uncharacterized protein LOC105200846 [Solenopsis invicta]|uniref:uncharacterized protein LOC105200846 n=1 Tax=Solenopsis invicta TaxID=13686 RepID=UPI000595E41E|nr:uncharacterized protein LOC105200846 [Solenopsis invicta]XP_025985841.1 uncharacterized protein LOC105200846 [Solenopsis invicta]XP_039315588.1 uncharacterized protein LOC105200846 [Solenopsis invicta]
MASAEDIREREMADEKIMFERLHDYLREYAKTIKLAAPKIHVTEGTNKGDNYVSLVCRGTIEGIEDGIEAKRLELILKTTRTYLSEEVLSDQSVTPLFQREAFFYQEILPIFKETMKERGGMADRFPVLLDYNDATGKEILMFESLTPQGFVMSETKIMDYPHASLAIKCLGEFHAYSFITRAANPAGFEKLRQMKDPIFQQPDENGEPTSKLNRDKMEHKTKIFVEAIFKVLANEDKHYIERYQQFIEKSQQHLYDVTDGKAAEPYAVVNHGDSWTNNMLFKYDQEKNPYDLRFVDLQICRYASPVLDLLYVFFCCCTQETRSKYYEQLIDEYYEKLSNTIEKAGYDPSLLFPYEALSQHLAKFGKYGAIMATYTLHIFTSNDMDLKKAYDEDLLRDRAENDSVFKSMVRGTFKDLIDRNYI